MFKVLLGALIGGAITGSAAFVIAVGLGGDLYWIVLLVTLAITPGAVVGAIAVATHVVTRSLRPQGTVSWDEVDTPESSPRA